MAHKDILQDPQTDARSPDRTTALLPVPAPASGPGFGPAPGPRPARLEKPDLLDRAPWDLGNLGSLGNQGQPAKAQGTTLMDVLLAPLEDVLDLLDDLGQSPVQPRKPETVLEWVHMGVPAFRLPEDVRGSFMNRVT